MHLDKLSKNTIQIYFRNVISCEVALLCNDCIVKSAIQIILNILFLCSTENYIVERHKDESFSLIGELSI